MFKKLDYDPDVLGKNVTIARMIKGLSQQELADNIKSTAPTIHSLEKAKRAVKVHTLIDVSNELEVTLEWLLTNK